MDIMLNYQPAGKVVEEFHKSKKHIKWLMGPVGGGKTTACIFDLLMTALTQKTNNEGIRKTRFWVVRNTYGDLWNTTIPSWKQWMQPEKWGQAQGTQSGAPYVHHIINTLADGTRIDCEVRFLACDDEIRIQQMLRGAEMTKVWFNEGDMLPDWLLSMALTRVGRYPAMTDGGPSDAGIIIDSNAPDEANYLYDLFFIKDDLKDAKLFAQPAGATDVYPDGCPDAENIANLPKGYYRLQRDTLRGMLNGEALIKRLIENKPGYSGVGDLIYPEFNPDLHIAQEELPYISKQTTYIGLDNGLTPAAVFMQQQSNGCLQVIDEMFFKGQKLSADDFARLLLAHIHTRYHTTNMTQFLGIVDPTACNASANATDANAWIDIVMHATQIKIEPALTNGIEQRIGAVKKVLQTLIMGRPKLIVSPHCKELKRGFSNGYKFRPKTSIPLKNDSSHLQDALQYAVMHTQGIESKKNTHKKRIVSNAYNPFATQGGAYV